MLFSCMSFDTKETNTRTRSYFPLFFTEKAECCMHSSAPGYFPIRGCPYRSLCQYNSLLCVSTIAYLVSLLLVNIGLFLFLGDCPKSHSKYNLVLFWRCELRDVTQLGQKVFC